MRKKGRPESSKSRSDRLEKRVQDRNDETSAEDEALDAAVRQSITFHGP
jgi:hypothetical protein